MLHDENGKPVKFTKVELWQRELTADESAIAIAMGVPVECNPYHAEYEETDLFSLEYTHKGPYRVRK